MEKVKTQTDLKPLLKETIEDISMANAVKEGRKNDCVSERKILRILDK